MDNKNNFKLKELHITPNGLDRFKVFATGYVNGENCLLEVFDVEQPNFKVDLRRDTEYVSNFIHSVTEKCSLFFNAKVKPVNGKYYSLTVPRVVELTAKIDELNEELNKLQNELKNISI